MSTEPAFTRAEYDERLAAVRRSMLAQGHDALLVSVPENIYYLTGLDHWGYFACHVLIVPLDGPLVLVARAMERITVEHQVGNAEFAGFADDVDPVHVIADSVHRLGLAGGRLALEKRSLFLTPRVAEAMQATIPGDWRDGSGLIDRVRMVKSSLEQEYTRRAATAADAGAQAAIAAVHDGASDHDVAGECLRAMILAGSEYPGFGPFIRPSRRLGEEHTTWCGDILRAGEAVLLELGAACYKYQAPMGRLVYVGHASRAAEEASELAREGMEAIRAAIRPGARAGDAYAAWRGVARAAGLDRYDRHHCGYLVGIGFPPSWTGGSMVTALSPDSELELQPGMAFHLHSWFTNTGRGDYFISNTALLTEAGCEILTQGTPETLQVR